MNRVFSYRKAAFPDKDLTAYALRPAGARAPRAGQGACGDLASEHSDMTEDPRDRRPQGATDQKP